MPSEKPLRIRIPIFSEAQRVVLEVDDATASFIGSYHAAIGNLLRTNRPDALQKFVEKYVTDVSGKTHLLETRPNFLYGLTAAEPDIMDQVYRILR